MNNFFRFINNKKYVLILILIAILSHLQWFNLFNILSFSDWYFWNNESASQLYNSYGSWLNFWGIGNINIQIFFNLFNFILSFIVNIGLSYDVAVKITFLIPMAIFGFLSPYFLSKKLIKNEFIAFISALFYGSISYFLIRQTVHIPIAFLFAFVPLILLFFIKTLEVNKIKNWIIFSIISFIAICYEVRITYIIFFILFVYFLMFEIKNIKKYLKNIVIFIFSLLFLNLFWFLPTLFGNVGKNIEDVANRGLFGSFLFDMKSAITIHDSPWTGGYPDMNFIKQPIQFYFWFIPIVIFSVFLSKNKKYKKEIAFFGIVSIIGIFLTKQEAEPFTKVYSWLYNNFPGFNLFREASKFYLITSIGYLGLLGYSLLLLKENKNKIFNKYVFSIFSSIIIIIAVINLKPLITGSIGTMFVSRHIPNDYLKLENFILKQPEFFRTYYTPRDSRWGTYTNEKPKVSNIDIIQSDWSNFIDSNQSIQNQIIDIYKKDFSNQLFDNSSIKYVIVPLQDKANDDDFFVYYGGQENPNIRQWYINQLDKIDWLKKINLDMKYLVVYENENYKDHIYSTNEVDSIYKNIISNNVEYKFINPTEYKISLKNINKTEYINFTDKFSSEWKLRLGKFNWINVLTNKNYFIDDKHHFENNAKLNSFEVDPEYIKKNFDKSYYKENPDGSIDIELTLYFKPQSYFYLGLIISGTTLIGCIAYLIVDQIKNSKLKNSKFKTEDAEEENKEN